MVWEKERLRRGRGGASASVRLMMIVTLSVRLVCPSIRTATANDDTAQTDQMKETDADGIDFTADFQSQYD